MDVASLSNVPSLSTAVLNAVMSLSNLSELIAIFPWSMEVQTFCILPIILSRADLPCCSV